MSEQGEGKVLSEHPDAGKPRSGNIPKLNIGGDNPKIVVISLIVTALTLALVAFVGGMGFVTKKDFTANMEGVSTFMEQAKVELTTARSEVAVAVAGIPIEITNQLGSIAKQDTSRLDSLLVALANRVATLESNTQADATTLSQVTVLETEVADLVTAVADLETVVTDYEERINDLEYRLTDSGTPAEEITTIWALNAYTNITSIGVDVSSYPYRIEEGGDYGITLDLFNNTETTINNVITTVTFTPRRNDRIIVDERDIYLYSYGSSLRWNVDVEVRSDGTCRQITFTSERFDLLPTDLSLEMDFTLEY